MVCVLFIGAILAKQGSMVAAIAKGMNVRVNFAENLKVILGQRDLTLDDVVNLNRNRLISLK